MLAITIKIAMKTKKTIKKTDRELNAHLKMINEDWIQQGKKMKCPKCGKESGVLGSSVCPVTQIKKKGSIEFGQLFGTPVYANCKDN